MRRCDARLWACSQLPKIALFLLWLLAPSWLHAQTIAGTIQDPSGAFIAGAKIEISGTKLAQPVVVTSDAAGKFASPDLKPGTYTLRVVLDGFETLEKTVELQGSLELQLTLSIAREQVNIAVGGKSLANS